MIKIENVDVYGWEAAIRGMRNPMNSWNKSDTIFFHAEDDSYRKIMGEVLPIELTGMGKNDLTLMKNLANAGSDHGKFLRMINVTMDITAPLYWWKEFDTYKVGTVANSCSTMHKIQAKEFTLEDFSHEHITCLQSETLQNTMTTNFDYIEPLMMVITALNVARKMFLKTNDKQYWWQMIQLLPSSYNQKRTVQVNYQVLKAIYHARKNHKLDEWHDFCYFCEELPYFKEICINKG